MSRPAWVEDLRGAPTKPEIAELLKGSRRALDTLGGTACRLSQANANSEKLAASVLVEHHPDEVQKILTVWRNPRHCARSR